MSKEKLFLGFLIAVIIVSSSINVYQWSNNIAMTKQSNDLATKQEMSILLDKVQMEASNQLQKLDANLQEACQRLSSAGIESSQVRPVLRELRESNSLIITASLQVDNILLVVEPEEFSYIEGSDVSNQEHTIKLQRTLRPVMSDEIKLVEDSYGVVLAAPIFDGDRTFVGSVTIVIQPSVLINHTITGISNTSSYSFMGIQIDGRVIYDVDQAQIGTETLSDPVFQDFPQLLSICERMVTEQAGYGTYEFKPNLSSPDVVHKELFWRTIGLYDTEWRIAVIHNLG